MLVLVYHAVHRIQPDYLKHLLPVCRPGDFLSDLELLAKNYEFVTFEQICDRYTQNGRFPENWCHITFDDGYANQYELAMEYLLPMGIPATFFVTKDFVDNKAMFYRNVASRAIEDLKESRRFSECQMLQYAELISKSNLRTCDKMPDELRALLAKAHQGVLDQFPFMSSEQICFLQRKGFSIGAHGIKHRKLSECDSADEILDEIQDSITFVEDTFSQKNAPFAFPFSGDERSRAVIREKYTGDSQRLFFDVGHSGFDPPFLVRRWAENQPIAARAGAEV